MRRFSLPNAVTPAAVFSIAFLLTAAPASAASNGNIDAAHARFITPDGAVYADNVTSVNQASWFAVHIGHDHSYEITAWVPDNNLTNIQATVSLYIYEADGTTQLAAPGTGGSEPAVYEAMSTGIGGDRSALTNAGTGVARVIKIKVQGPPSSSGLGFVIRVVDTTQVAARWTVNGYQAFFALHNFSNGTVVGSILYYASNGTFLAADPFTIPGNGTVQIVKPNSVAIGGELAGGVRLVFDRVVAGLVRAEEYNYNGTTGQYLTFDFGPVSQSAAGVRF